MFRRRIAELVSVGVLAAFAAPAAGPSREVDAKALPEWPLAGGDSSNSRFSTLTQITRDNIGRLAGAWTKELDGALRAMPLVSGGLLFIPTRTQVHAFRAADAKEVWTYRPGTPISPNLKGLAAGDGLLFVGLVNASMIALRQETGELVWTYSLRRDGERVGPVSSPSTYAEGVVLVPVSGGDSNLRGRLVGLDAKTGRELWVFDAVPSPGQPGFETWPKDTAAWRFGGGAIWMPPAVDPELGIAYVGVGNASPQFGGDIRKGDNLFTDCVVALDLKTGRMRWYRQLVHHDIWDYDLSTPLVLYDAETNGQRRKAVAVMRTDGYLFSFDRASGMPVSAIEERAVPQNAALHTSPTQPFPVGGEQIGPNCAEPGLMPEGFALGCYFDPLRPDMPNFAVPFMTTRFAPMSFSSATGYFYVTACVAPWWVRRPDNGWLHGDNVHVPGQHWYGIVAAIDGRTNRIAWQQRVPVPMCGGSGTLSTASGLVFTASPDGNMTAYDARTGESLWQFQTGRNGPTSPIGPASVPMIAYEAEGRQFVASLMERELWAFALDGRLSARAPAGPPPVEQPFTAPIEEVSNVRLAKVIMQNNPDTGVNEPWHDEHGISPTRVRVRAGTTVTWTNGGRMKHALVARDGTWSTESIAPGESARVTFDRPGVYTYICRDHPWSIAQITVE
jgi:alcohol dehydrogenase (cytochrome c)